ncbi:hypothetical protein HOI83_03335 [Candidatus Uhrbacteria bacterium]|jgi:hypothetical protein|nr:hypothetical protein [Candidatus Uhrbacteria bacterium]
MAHATFMFFWLLALVLNTDKLGVEKGVRSTMYIVAPKFLGMLLKKFATKLSSVEVGFNDETGKYAVIVADKGVIRSTVEMQLPAGYKQLASIKRAGGTMFGRVTGNVADFVDNKAFLTGIETVLMANFADGDIEFRHAKTDAGDICVIQFRVIDFESYTGDDITAFSTLLTTPDGTVIRFIETVDGVDYMVTDDACYTADGTNLIANAQSVLEDGGAIMTLKMVEHIDLPDAAPVTLVRIGKVLVVGYDDGHNTAIGTNQDPTEITAITAKSEFGAMLALDLVTDTPMAVFDDGDTMSYKPLDLPEAFIAAMQLSGPTKTVQLDQTVN